MPQDYYDLLNVPRDVDGAALKKAYRQKAMQFHPDRNPDNPDAEATFKDLSMAYDVLRNPDKRAAYDRYGHAAFDGSAGQGASGFDFASSFSDVFDDLFGEFMGTRRRSSATRGADLRFNLAIELIDAYRGKSASIRVPTTAACQPCGGSGAKPGSSPTTCPTCQGAGRVRAQQGFFTIERTCPGCAGAGRVIGDPCAACGGNGRVQKERQLSVDIPAGIEEGTRIRLSGEGEAGLRGGPAGDLYIFLSIAPHQIFERDGADLHCSVPIPMVDAALGDSIEVPTLGGERTRIGIPAGSQSGRQFRLRGKGMPHLRSTERGDLYIQIAVETPVKLTRRQKELLASFREESTRDGHHPESEGFFTKVREFFDNLAD